MKSIGLLIVAAIFLSSQMSAHARENEFIHAPGQYSLDGKGSTLTITKAPTGPWVLKAVWRTGDSTSSAAPEDCLRANGWFVFVEKPGRLWIFDGKDDGILLSNFAKETRVSTFSPEVMASCPQKVWDALPQEVRKRYRNVKRAGEAANRGEPGSPEINRTSAATGSAR